VICLIVIVTIFDMPRLVLTVIGDDRAGLVSSLADVIASYGGNWEESQMAELAGKFAGIVVVSIPPERLDGFLSATHTLDGLLEVSVHTGAHDRAETDQESTILTLAVLGNDRPGIVHELSTVLSTRGLSIDRMTTNTREAPMAGGLLFEATIDVRVPPQLDFADVRADLERIAADLGVDLDVDQS
jgi:glycine cleavage system regulatory protein